MDQRVRSIIAFMRANLDRQISVDEMANAVQLSPSHLSQLFKAATGATLTSYLRKLRMARAKELLETTFLSIKQVAAHVGINSVSHFVTDFKKLAGVTPSRYAARNRKISNPAANH